MKAVHQSHPTRFWPARACGDGRKRALVDAEWIERWTPRSSWADMARPAVEALWADRGDFGAWARIAMILGDTHAPALCFAVARYALDRSDPADPSRGRLSGHAALAALDLGFATYTEGSGVQVDHGAERRWFDETFAQIGDLERSALFSLCLLAFKLGLVEGPEPPTVDDLCTLERWDFAPTRDGEAT